jgi:carboxypeptidase T
MNKKTICSLALSVFLLLAAASCFARSPLNPTDESGYLSSEETVDRLRALAAARPDLARIHSLGKTWEGRDIWAVSLGFDQDSKERSKPEILVIGGQHANEWISIEVVRYLAERLVKDCTPGSEIEKILKQANIWFVPIVNPDGYEYARNEDRFWRKNRRLIGGTTYGVDPNRNWPHMWRLPDPDNPGKPLAIGGSDDPTSRWFRGFSDGRDHFKPFEHEPEIAALLSLLNNPDRNFALFLDYHSFSELVLYPPGFSKEPSLDEEAYLELAEGMTSAINSERRVQKKFKLLKIGKAITSIPFPEKYASRHAGRLYSNVATGGSIDTTYHRYGIWSLAIELPPNEGHFIGRREALYVSGQGFRLDSDYIEPTCLENWKGFIFAVRWALSHPAPKVLELCAVQ